MPKKKKTKQIDLSPYLSKTPKQRHNLDKSLRGINLMRHGRSIDEASQEAGVSRRTMIRSVRSALYKVGNTWMATEHDNIPRPPMAIYEGGERKWIDVADSDTARIIGQYNSARAVFLERLDPSVLEPYRGAVVQDMYGNKYTLDTDPALLFEAERKKPEGEPYEVYKYGG